MSWKVRHEGSSKAVEGLTPQQIVEGLQDGLWETTDEVMGPNDSKWVAIEGHPQFEEIAADIEPPPPRHDEDESKLDMTPLIDVCLVLLIFMILTLSYGAVQRQIEAARMTPEGAKDVRTVSNQVVLQTMIVVKAAVEGDATVVRIEDQPVEESNLTAALRTFVRDTGKVELLIQPGPGVRRKSIIAIQDAAAGAGINKIHVVVPKELLPTAAPKPVPPPE